jgi:hypothetical protein
MKKIVFYIGCMGCILLGALICLTLQHSFQSANAAKDGLGAAAEWKSLSAYERSAYVEGYTDGYSAGASSACDNADQLFDIKGQALLSNGTPDNPVRLCNSALDHFTRMGPRGKLRANYSIYSDVITEFYNKYPKYNIVPFGFLLRLLSDKSVKTADELFAKLERHDTGFQTTF